MHHCAVFCLFVDIVKLPLKPLLFVVVDSHAQFNQSIEVNVNSDTVEDSSDITIQLCANIMGQGCLMFFLWRVDTTSFILYYLFLVFSFRSDE